MQNEMATFLATLLSISSGGSSSLELLASFESTAPSATDTITRQHFSNVPSLEEILLEQDACSMTIERIHRHLANLKQRNPLNNR